MSVSLMFCRSISASQFPAGLRCFDCGAPATITVKVAQTVPATLEREDRGYCLCCWARVEGGPTNQTEEKAHG